MSYFINYLRILATILITNSHYGNIWPIPSMAAGGLLGNILFFAVSGFCLLTIKDNFFKWYGKRILRVYPAMVVFVLVACLFGKYPLTSIGDAFRLFVYPTRYAFLVWLMLCYILFYAVAWLDKRYKNVLEIALLVVMIAWLTVYVLFVDKKTYNVDVVENPFILFLYFSSMLAGALFKKHATKLGKLRWYEIALTVVSLIAYFASKVVFVRYSELAPFQIMNQFVIFLALCFVFRTFMGLENVFAKTNDKWNRIVRFFANLTLQIYIVQFLIIAPLQDLPFPVNFIVTTLAIFAAATGLYLTEWFIRKGIQKLVDKRKKNYANDNA